MKRCLLVNLLKLLCSGTIVLNITGRKLTEIELFMMDIKNSQWESVVAH